MWGHYFDQRADSHRYAAWFVHAPCGKARRGRCGFPIEHSCRKGPVEEWLGDLRATRWSAWRSAFPRGAGLAFAARAGGPAKRPICQENRVRCIPGNRTFRDIAVVFGRSANNHRLRHGFLCRYDSPQRLGQRVPDNRARRRTYDCKQALSVRRENHRASQYDLGGVYISSRRGDGLRKRGYRSIFGLIPSIAIPRPGHHNWSPSNAIILCRPASYTDRLQRSFAPQLHLVN